MDVNDTTVKSVSYDLAKCGSVPFFEGGGGFGAFAPQLQTGSAFGGLAPVMHQTFVMRGRVMVFALGPRLLVRQISTNLKGDEPGSW